MISFYGVVFDAGNLIQVFIIKFIIKFQFVSEGGKFKSFLAQESIFFLV